MPLYNPFNKDVYKASLKFAPHDSKMDKKLVTLTERLDFKLAIFLVSSMTTISGVVIAPALPYILKAHENVPHIDILVPLIMSLPPLFVALFAPLAGYLMDKFHKIGFLYFGMVVWSISGMSGAFCENIYTLLCTRAIFGIGTAFVMNGANVLLADYYSRGGYERREKALGGQNAMMAFGGVSMMFLVGFLVSLSSDAAFFVYGVGLLILLYSIFYLFEPRGVKKEKLKILDSS